MKLLVQAFTIFWGAIFSALFIHVLISSNFLSESSIYLYMVSGLAWCTLFIVLYSLCIRHSDFIIKYESIIISLFFLFIVPTLSISAYLLEVETAWDVKAVYRGAINIATTGQLGEFYEYFHIFPHNLGATLYLSGFFYALNTIGFDDFYTIGTMVNILSICIAYFFTYKTIRLLHGPTPAFTSILLSMSCLPLYLYATVFYTDTLSIGFSAIVLYGIFRLNRMATYNIKNIGILILFSLALFIGAKIKVTILIILIAGVLSFIAFKSYKKAMLLAGINLFMFFILSLFFSHFTHSNLLNEQELESKKTPYSHWVMMGLKGNGGYNPEDYELTKSQPNQKQKISTNIKVIRSRLKNMDIHEFYNLVKSKQLHNFGNGTFAASDMLDDGPVRKGLLHSFALVNGEHYRTYAYIAHGYHLFILFIIVLGCIFSVFSYSSSQKFELIVVRLSLLGIFIFLMFWETSPRYIINFIPIFTACAAMSILESTSAFKLFTHLKSKNQQKGEDKLTE